jgi:fructose 1,6-bisphosphate aldolase/phosphatase
MKITVSAIKADIGSIGGHTAPSPAVMEAVGACVRKEGRGLIADFATSPTGDGVAILMTHGQGREEDGS